MNGDSDLQQSSAAVAQARAARVLLAEDNLANRRVAEIQLRRLGYDPVSVLNGRECVSAYMQPGAVFHLILMDCNMPLLDGYAATQYIRRAEQGLGDKHIPIVAMTANVMDGDRELCLAAGMDDYLPKPVTQEVLRTMLAKWITAI